jgi:hypothetical protein
MPKLTADESRDLARRFRGVAIQLGDFRFAKWDKLTPNVRQRLESLEWTLLNYSSDFTTQATALSLNEADGSLKEVKAAAKAAKDAIATIKTARKAIGVAAACVKLAAGIVTKDPAVIVGALEDTYKVINA